MGEVIRVRFGATRVRLGDVEIVAELRKSPAPDRIDFTVDSESPGDITGCLDDFPQLCLGREARNERRTQRRISRASAEFGFPISEAGIVNFGELFGCVVSQIPCSSMIDFNSVSETLFLPLKAEDTDLGKVLRKYGQVVVWPK